MTVADMERRARLMGRIGGVIAIIVGTLALAGIWEFIQDIGDLRPRVEVRGFMLRTGEPAGSPWGECIFSADQQGELYSCVYEEPANQNARMTNPTYRRCRKVEP